MNNCQRNKFVEHFRKLRFQKTAQAAMEFLMTYGWALLVVLAAIGALAYFGVLKPQSFLPEQCVLAPGVACLDFRINSTGIDFVIGNSLIRH